MAGVGEVAKEAGLNPVRCPHCGKKFGTTRVIARFFRLVANYCQHGERVILKDFGTFFCKTHKGRTLKTPLMKGGKVTFKDSLVLTFKQSSVIKDVINSKRRRQGKG